ncbi:MAG: S8 family serine peptidase [Tannerellaceae bacterium]|jgi:subtilisin family serine protease|nr:S8 family serine peptidase [Tannerellaceae bacterium]
MKNYWILLLLAFIATSCQDFAEERLTTSENTTIETRASKVGSADYYWYNGEKIHLTRSEKYVNVVTNGKLVKSSKAEVTTNSLSRNEETKYVLPFFERGEGVEPIGTSDIFYLKLKQSEDITLLEKMAAELGVQVFKEIPYTPRWYTLSILGSKFSSSIEASNYFYETGKFEDVDPAFMFDFKPSANDPDFWRQWGMNNTSHPGIDINAILAWNITRGAGVKVAVVDSPIESGHDDLDDNIHSLSYNANLMRTPSAPYVQGFYPPAFIGTENHGTHVAGIIGAEKNSSQVMGVAYESEIMRVSHYLLSSNTFSAEMASGINWAWQNEADVINCSWGDQGGQAYNQLHSTILEQAITNAMTQGRKINGTSKGSVVVFASGNYGHSNPGYIDYPGNFHPNILVVGAIGSNGSRLNTSSYGTALDVVAPGGSIWSTIPQGNTDYMSGTSMAAPHVAGIAALILSAYPNLTRQQVVNKIESTTQKVGGSYSSTSGRPNGTWNSQTGYGLVDAYVALTGTPAIVPNTPVISHELFPQPNSNQVTVVFSVDSPQSGVTYQWELNGTIMAANDPNPYIAFLSALLTARNVQPTTIRLTLRCRAVYRGSCSAWSNSIFHGVQSLTPILYTPGI